MMIIRAFLVFGFGLGIFQGHFCQAVESKEKLTLKDDEYHFEVRTDHQSKKVYLDTLTPKSDLPNEMSLTLYDNQQTGRTISLQLIKTPALSNPAGVTPHQTYSVYQGKYEPFGGSIVGAELQISVGGGSKVPRILRWSKK
jgi:hypothetical protein